MHTSLGVPCPVPSRIETPLWQLGTASPDFALVRNHGARMVKSAPRGNAEENCSTLRHFEHLNRNAPGARSFLDNAWGRG